MTTEDPNRLRCRRGPGPAWPCRQPRAAGRQRHRHQFFVEEVAAKRLRLLHDLVPKAIRIAVLVNPANASSAQRRLEQGLAHNLGLVIAKAIQGQLAAAARLALGGEYGQSPKEVGCESEEGKAQDPHQGKDQKASGSEGSTGRTYR